MASQQPEEMSEEANDSQIKELQDQVLSMQAQMTDLVRMMQCLQIQSQCNTKQRQEPSQQPYMSEEAKLWSLKVEPCFESLPASKCNNGRLQSSNSTTCQTGLS